MKARYCHRVRSVVVSNHPVPGFDDDHTVPDQLGELAQRYGIGSNEGRAVLIRPDMYIGAHCSLHDAGLLVDFNGAVAASRTFRSLTIPSLVSGLQPQAGTVAQVPRCTRSTCHNTRPESTVQQRNWARQARRRELPHSRRHTHPAVTTFPAELSSRTGACQQHNRNWTAAGWIRPMLVSGKDATTVDRAGPSQHQSIISP